MPCLGRRGATKGDSNEGTICRIRRSRGESRKASRCKMRKLQLVAQVEGIVVADECISRAGSFLVIEVRAGADTELLNPPKGAASFRHARCRSRARTSSMGSAQVIAQSSGTALDFLQGLTASRELERALVEVRYAAAGCAECLFALHKASSAL